MNISRIRRQSLACIAAALMAHAGLAQLSTQFTYQGELQADSVLASGQYQMRFKAFDSSLGGIQLGSTNIAVVDVVNGKFSVLLDFGSSLNNVNAHLEVEVRPNGSLGAFTMLAPRQRLTATPNAFWASAAATATNALSANSAATATNATTAANATQLGGQAPTFYQNATNLTTGVIPDARLGSTVARTTANQTFSGVNQFTNNANIFTGQYLGNGSLLTALDASAITAGTLANVRTTGTPNSVPNTLVLRDGGGNFSAATVTATTLSGSGAGITNLNASNILTGTLAAARLPATVARTDIANAFGNFTNSFAGSVGIGTTTPVGKLHVDDFGPDIAIFGGAAAGSSQLLLGTSTATNGYATIQGVRASGSQWGDVVFNPFAGNVGVGITAPLSRFHVRSQGNIATLIDSDSNVGTWFTLNNRAGVAAGQRFWTLLNTAPGNGAAGNLQFAVGSTLGVADAIPMVINRDGRVGIGTTSPLAELHVVGTTRTNVLEIMGGSDIAEPYCVAPSQGVQPEPGMVVSIDPDHVGKLRVSSSAYDTTVAGIVSGANGVNVGLTLRQEGSKVADGSLPIANVGRVWCWVDADAGAIKPGDLLTTSDTPGHAMKADPAKANGAILGKAMSRLESGKGMVLVLVGLQ